MTPLALLMHRNIKHVSSQTTLREAARKMRDESVGSLLVSEGEEKVGIISDVDFVRKAIAEGINPDTAEVQSIMSHPIITIDIEETAKEANDCMAEHSIRHLVVTDGKKIVGIISMRDLILCYKNRR